MARLLTTAMLIASCVCVQTAFAQDKASTAPEGKAVATDKASTTTDAKAAKPSLFPRVKFVTTLGDFVVELNGEKAPITTRNFLQYVDDGFYVGTVFHRVMKNFMIQGGGFTPELDQKREGIRPAIKNEWRNGLKNEVGTISMARLGRQPDSATCQFFINVVDNKGLDLPRDGAGYAVFGKVVEGMDTIEAIRFAEVTTNKKYPGGAVVPATPIVINKTEIVVPMDCEAVDAKVAKAEELARKAKEEQEKKEAAEKAEATKLIEDMKAKATKSETGLLYTDIEVGAGRALVPTDKIKVHYTGWLMDGTKFDSSLDSGNPLTAKLSGGLIAGFLEGLQTMKVGGKRFLIIPADLGYGSRNMGKIPPNSTLAFQIEVVSVIE